MDGWGAGMPGIGVLGLVGLLAAVQRRQHPLVDLTEFPLQHPLVDLTGFPLVNLTRVYKTPKRA